MRIAIIGSRGLNVDIEKYLPKDVLLEELELVSGGATGIDTAAERFADQHNIPKLIFKPDYARYGRSAPIRRNNLIIDACEMAICIWDGASRGTHYTLDYAIRKGIPTLVVVIDPATGVEISRKMYNQ